VHGADPMTMSLVGHPNPLEYAAVITAAIALTHSGFNIANTALFLPFVKPFGRLLERLFPDPRFKEVSRLKHVDARAVSAPVLGVEQSRGEVLQMGQGTIKMAEWIRQLGFHGPWDERMVQKAFHREEVLDSMQREVVAFLTDVLDATVPHAIAEEGRQQLRIAHEYESISDRLASVLRAFGELRQKRLEFGADQRAELLGLHDEVTAFLRAVTEAYGRRSALNEAAANSANASISRRIRGLQDAQLQRMIDSAVDPGFSLLLAGLLTDYRRIRAHTLNIHEAVAGSEIFSGVGAGSQL
jgi:phosphate:Na+ symporter